MKIFIILIFFALISNDVFANEVTVIKLHNKSLDQLLNESIENNEEIKILISDDNEINEVVEEESSEVVEEESSEVVEEESSEVVEEENSIDIENATEENIESTIVLEDNLLINDELEPSDLWEQITKEDLFFLLKNIKEIRSPVLKNELLLILSLNNLVSKNFVKEDFDKMIVDSLLSLGDRKKSYQIIQNFQEIENTTYNTFYKEFELNYLLSTYKLSEACDYRNEIKDPNLISSSNFFLKVDIFCLVLQEKLDEANLLNSLLIETAVEQDQYFQFLFNKLLNIESNIANVVTLMNEKNIFLYSAMHRIRNLPLSDKFLEIDPINLSLPIILSSTTEIQLRLKAAHLAYLNQLINVDSLAALYQTVDFSYDQLNDPSTILPSISNNVEIGMTFFYQLINIQLLPKTRLEAILKFWEFSEQNNLELISYALSLRSLNTIEPSNEFSSYGAKIAKAYSYNKDFIRAAKWLLYSENSLSDEQSLHELNSSKLLYNLFNIGYSENLINVLYDNLQFMNKNLIDKNNPTYLFKKELLYLIFSILNENNNNPFEIDKKIIEIRLMPSIYIINKIREAIINQNHPELLLAIIASINGKEWNEIHPEHFRLILIGLKEYNDGSILNKILLEILMKNKII